MLRVLLDSNGVDPLVDQPGALEAIEDAKARGALDLMIAASAFEELATVKDSNKDRRVRLLLAASRARIVPDGAFVFDKSRLDQARLGDAAVFAQLKAGNDAHIEDAVIIMAAKAEGAVLVTNEKRLPRKAQEVGVKTMTTAELLTQIQ
jgi:rRNA-processing protein FCF1